ncbi:hypothetical protein B0H34DRAFT_96680 [Crassisporium funariophilum]|nr:hypothetical protein B0H34DRAFT_96680 [Crassisporium funariophilum]
MDPSFPACSSLSNITVHGNLFVVYGSMCHHDHSQNTRNQDSLNVVKSIGHPDSDSGEFDSGASFHEGFVPPDQTMMPGGSTIDRAIPITENIPLPAENDTSAVNQLLVGMNELPPLLASVPKKSFQRRIARLIQHLRSMLRSYIAITNSDR